jgi:HAD superfamily hydrolase (TIGR01450 family)
LKGITRITIDEVIDRYAVLLLDAYGVLVHTRGVLYGAVELIDRLERIGKDYFILTNDASKLPSSMADRFRDFGLRIAQDRIISSGQLLEPYFADHQLKGGRCVVLGPPDSAQYTMDAGGRVVSPSEDFDALVICDEAGFPLIETMDAVLTTLYRKLDRGENVHLILPNPDLVYLKSARGYGFTSGSLALMIEAALDLRYPGAASRRFVRLGKPQAPIFEEARKWSRTGNMVMIGDQLETDIQGANNYGIDSVLIDSGITKLSQDTLLEHLQPTYIMSSL